MYLVDLSKTGDEIHYVYALIDPRNGKPFYVGRSELPEVRFKDHIKEGNHKWSTPDQVSKRGIIKSILNDGLTPTLKVLEVTTRKYAPSREWAWWAVFMGKGFAMTNRTWEYLDGAQL